MTDPQKLPTTLRSLYRYSGNLRIMRKAQYILLRWMSWRDTADELNRRVEVENRLLMAASGKQPLPDADECRRLAYKLGVPSWFGGNK